MAAAALAIVATSGCERNADTTAAADAAATAQATADQKFADYYVRQKAGVDIADVPLRTRAELLEQLARLRATAARGERQATPDVVGAIELARLETLARSAAEAAGVFAEPSAAELQGAYEAYVQSLPPKEFHAQHILVATEPSALAVIAALDGGASFGEVAAQRSADADSATRGGDLGWIRPGHLPQQLFQVLGELADGAYGHSPVKTNYGWHVIRRVGARAGSPLPFEQVRAQLVANLQQQRYEQFLQDSVAAAGP